MFRRLLLMFAFVSAASGSAFGDVIEARNVAVKQNEGGLVVNADFRLELSARLEEALNHGVSLHFVVEFELVRPRWYWFDEKTVSERRVLRLFYHPLSRQYRLSRGALYQNFATLDEALRTMATVRDWAVVERESLTPGAGYLASLRMRLDTGQLPKPFQVSALIDREWTLASEWKRVVFTAAEGPAR